MPVTKEQLQTAQISQDPKFQDNGDDFLATVERIAAGGDLDELALINPEDLGESFKLLPSQTAYWSTVAAGAQSALTKAERDFKHKEAALSMEIRHALEYDPQVAKVTEAMIEKTMLADQRWVDLHSKLEAAQVVAAHARVRMDVLRVKREALASFGALRRAEMAANVYAAA